MKRAHLLGAAVLVAIVFLFLRFWLATTPLLSETYYDEALTGLMAFAILRGIPQVFSWGQPYLGAHDAYLAAAGFWVFGPSTLVLRMSTVAVAVLWAWGLWSVARRSAGEGWALLAGLCVAVPPIFLSYVQLSAHSQALALTFGVLTLAAGTWLLDPTVGRRGRVAAWCLLGLAGGLGWWASQIMGVFLLAVALTVVGARPRVLRGPGPYVAVGLFVLASWPFWRWNMEHEWATFWHLATWGQPPAGLVTRVERVTGTLLATLQGFFWDGRAVRPPASVERLGQFLVLTVYAPAAGLAVLRLATWARRLVARERPWQDPLDLVVIAFWLTVAAHLGTWFGTSGVLRYSITFFATLPVLAAVWLSRLWRSGRVGRVVAVGLAAGLLGHNLITHLLFVAEAGQQPRRPVDAVIARLHGLGIRACYADDRIAQVIAFESLERIACIDYEGLRDFALLQAVDAVEDPGAVAIVTHRALREPEPDAMADTLRLMGADARREEVGEYVIFHHVRPPDPGLRPLSPSGWSARASSDSDVAHLAFDRRVWTRWSASKQGGEWFEVDLGGVHRLVQLTLETGPWPEDGPAGLRVETSRDGRVWETAAAVPEIVPGVHWWKGHPRVDDSGRVIVRVAPRTARYVRLVQTGQDEPEVRWSLGELFVYETADGPGEPPTAARAAVVEARHELARWMDDPNGPNPKRAPVTFERRRGQVHWAALFEAANRALDLGPEWEETHHLYAAALQLSGWTNQPDVDVARAQEDGAWREVLRWAERAEAQEPAFWRSGRDVARVEALARLGRPVEADAARLTAARVEAEQQPGPRAWARFGDALELTGMEFPAEVRAGERVLIRHAWRALRDMDEDYWAFVRLAGSGRTLKQDHLLGGGYATSRWTPGERTREILTLVVPADAPSGSYEVRIGVWRPTRRKFLAVGTTDLPPAGHAVVVGRLQLRARE